MPFPDYDRVIYRKNPLFEVICQLRFEPILLIEAELPALFQEHIREQYPSFEQHQKIGSDGDAKELLAALAQQPPAAQHLLRALGRQSPERTIYNFVSFDGLWKVTLARDFVALTTTEYERWEDFRARLSAVTSALAEVYRPPFFTRVGLRYRDAIERSKIGLRDAAWAELIRPEILGELAISELVKDVVEATRSAVFRLHQFDGSVALRHGLAINADTNETGYLIDADFFTQGRIEVDDAPTVLEAFNKQSGRLFRWCITDQLHRAMEPEDPESPK
jgi:uncharacterized protein (TIGR04255 family)